MPTITTLGGRIQCNQCQAKSKRSKLQCRGPAVLESVGFTLNLLSGSRTRGRKPNRIGEAYPELQESLKRMMPSIKADHGS